MIGQVIGNYRLVSELGKGGMGVVYVAEHVQLGRPAALKMLLPQFSSDEAIVQRFFNEARAASAIDHPGIVEIYEFGTHHDGRAFIVMALLRGETLQQRLARAPLAPVEGATIVAQVASALAAAHARGIVHRDLKPDNIFLVPNELMPCGVQAKLLDFGIAKLADERASFKTQTGSLIGTPAYMSPEQCMGRSDLDHRTDLYALGCILFHVLCGRPPFVCEGGAGPMIAAHLRDPAPDPRAFNPYLSEPLARIVLRLLEKAPEARFQTAHELRDALMLAGATITLTQAPAETMPTTGPRYHGPEAYQQTTAPTTSSGSAAQVVTQPAPRSRAGLWIGLALAVAAIAGAAVVVSSRRDDRTPQIAADGAGSSAAGSTAHAPAAPETGTTGGSTGLGATGPGAGAEAIGGSSEPGSNGPASTGAIGGSTGPGSSGTGGAGEPGSSRPHGTGPGTIGAGATGLPSAHAGAVACFAGQVRNDDTQGHCCWPEQAWSTAKGRCVGTPRCPKGMAVVRGDQCVATAVELPATATAAPRFTLDKRRYAPGETVELRFAQPVPSAGQHRAWVTLVEASKPAESYGAWEFVVDNARAARLPAPRTPGVYEARVHTDYSTRMYNLRHAVRFEVAAAAPTAEAPAEATPTPRARQRFTVRTPAVAPREPITVVFPSPMRAVPGERFWITVVKAGTADTGYAAYEYVSDGATTATLQAPAAAGDYEVRLHANYPTKSTNLVYRAPVRVLATP